MGLRDRHYMQGPPDDSDESSIGTFVGRLVTVLLGIVLFVFCIRFPLPLPFKLLSFIGLAFLFRFLWHLPSRLALKSSLEEGLVAEKNGNHMKAAYHYDRALGLEPTNASTAIRLLSAYEATGQIVKAKKLIRALDGIVIPDQHVEEFEHLVVDYRLVTLEKVKTGQRVKLLDA